MPTFMAVTTLSGEEAATALALRIESQLSSVTATVTGEIEDGSGLWEVAGYFDRHPDELRLSLLVAATGADARPFVISELPETGWVERAQRQLAPVRAGRFFVYGRHDADKKPTDAISLLVEAAMAFGTGHHGTTRGCLLAIDELARDGHAATSILDLGCGTAILAMAAARVFDAEVIASDIDPSAVETAQANVAANDLSGQIRVMQGNGFDHPEIRASAPFDLLLANILEKPLLAMAGDFADHCGPCGRVVLSGILASRSQVVVRRFHGVGFIESEVYPDGEWATLVLGKETRLPQDTDAA